VNHRLVRHLLDQGHAVTLAASVVDPALLREPGVEWLRIPVPRWLPDLAAWALFALLAWLRLRPARLSRYDVVHLNGAIAPLPAHVNTCHYVHASWLAQSPRRNAWRPRAAYHRLAAVICAWCERRAYRSAKRVAAVSDLVRDALVREVGIPAEHVRVIPTGVDSAEFRPAEPGGRSVLRGTDGVPHQAFLLMFVGDAKTPRKNLDLALEALARLDDRFRLVVIGDARGGPYRERARQLGVAPRVRFAGVRHDIADCLRDADAVLCPSRYEPASLVLLEAMATGVPVIATRQVGNAAFIDDGRNGFLVGVRDAAHAAGILTRLADDPALHAATRRAARATALRLSWDRMGRGYERLYGEATRTRAAVRWAEAGV
jgi:glycosyltransferase involved in cell wall biosynthesis